MANRLHIVLFSDPLLIYQNWYLQAIYFDLKVNGWPWPNHCCLASGPDLSLRSVSSFSRVDVMWWQIFREFLPNFEAKKLFVSWSLEGWQILVSFVIKYWRLWCSKYPKSQGISSILGAKYFKWMRFCWNAWMAGVSRVVGGECECLPSQFLRRHTREVTAMYQEVPRAVRRVVPVFFGDFGREKHGLIGLEPVILLFRVAFVFYHAIGEVEFYTI